MDLVLPAHVFEGWNVHALVQAQTTPVCDLSAAIIELKGKLRPFAGFKRRNHFCFVGTCACMRFLGDGWPKNSRLCE
jgi:hypothetical protein